MLFPLYEDSNVGLSFDQMKQDSRNSSGSDHLIETTMDDDADTDMEVMDSAIEQVYADYKAAEYWAANTDYKLGNITVLERIRHPELYDRDGKLRTARWHIDDLENEAPP